MAQDEIDKIITIQFKYSDLIEGWARVSEEIDKVNAGLKQLKQDFKDGQIGSANYRRALAELTAVKRSLNDQLRQFTREIQSNIREEIKQEGSIDQLRASVGKLTAQYNKLSREERNAARGTELSKKIAEIQTELNEANASLLNFRDNVGNYASAAKGFTPLSFQVQQLAREMPSLTMSLQQFFLAISNNVPMFADELKRARIANAALRAEGKATVPVFRQVISSIFSWQTALVVGITLITAFGKEIGEWIKGLFDSQHALSESAKHVQGFNQSVAESREELKREFDALASASKGTREYAAARKVIEEKYGAYLANQREEIRNLENQKDAYEALAKSITATAIAEGLKESNADAVKEYSESMEKALSGVQKKFIKKFGRDIGIAYFTEFRAGLDSEIPELRERADEIYKMFHEESFYRTGNRTGTYTTNELAKSVYKARKAFEQYNKAISANQIAMNTLTDIYKISAEDQKESINDLLKLKEKELADINNEVATTEKEIASRNKRAEAVENEIKRLRELGRANKDADKQAKERAKEINLYVKNLSAAIKETTSAENYLLDIVQSMREKTQENELKNLRENYDKEVDAFWQKLNDENIDTETAYKISLALEEKFQRNKQEIINKYSKKRLKEDLEEQERAYKNRIDSAQLQGGDLAAARELLNIYKEQIEQLEKLEGLYRAAGKTDEEIQAKRIEYRKGIVREENNIADLQLRNTTQTLNAAQQAAGGFAAMFEALGGEGERYAEFVKALSVMQVLLAQSVAIANAWSGNAKLPWPANLLATAASVAAIVGAIASVASSTESAKTPKYAEGGLVTGPGSGTSDSIAARLSNGEAVMTARAVNDWGAVLSAINVSSGGRAIDTSNLPERGDGMRGFKRIMEQVMQEMPNPVVYVKDINSGQARAKVAVSLGKLGRRQKK